MIIQPMLTRQIGDFKWQHFEEIIRSNYDDIPDNIRILVELTGLWVHYINIQNGILDRISERFQGSYEDIKEEFKNQLEMISKHDLKEKLKI